jgi:hypothetical protein
VAATPAHELSRGRNHDLLDKLGKHKSSVGCLYIKRLADVDQAVLAALIEASFTYMKSRTA